jgi:hypothetical protein
MVSRQRQKMELGLVKFEFNDLPISHLLPAPILSQKLDQDFKGRST